MAMMIAQFWGLNLSLLTETHPELDWHGHHVH
jgi:hypothetical protein